MKRITLLSVLLLLALAVAACAPSTPTVLSTSTSSVPVTGGTETPGVVNTATAFETATTETTEAPTTAATESTGTGLTISTSSSPDMAQPFLVDDQGRVLYVFTNDTQNSGTSACTGDCLAAWPAVVVTGPAVAGEGVDPSLLGTITRDDGTMQVTYNGWPLYYYSGDAAPGDMTGQGMNGVWYVVSGAGTAIQQ